MYAGIGLCIFAVLVMVLLRPYPRWGAHGTPRDQGGQHRV
jgi:hypothetical protein